MSQPVHIQARIEARNARLQRLGFESYPAYLRSPTWKRKRAEYRASGRPMECACGANRVQLHHLTYERVGGDELLDDLQPLCAECHSMAHALERRRLVTLDLDGFALDQERAAERQQQRADRDRTRVEQRQAFNDLPLHVRLARLDEASRAGHGHLDRHLRTIRHMIEKAEGKIDKAAPRIERQVASAALAIELRDPDLFAQLVNADGMDVIPDSSLRRDPDCDESMTCECAKCAAEREARVRAGVRPRRPMPRRRAA